MPCEAALRAWSRSMISVGEFPVREEDDVAPLNTYLRWLPACFNPAKDRRQWYTQLFFAQHLGDIAQRLDEVESGKVQTDETEEALRSAESMLDWASAYALGSVARAR
jgi:hypothetical protein